MQYSLVNPINGRWYYISVHRDMFHVNLLCIWGGKNCKPSGRMNRIFDLRIDAIVAAHKILRKRLNNGYKIKEEAQQSQLNKEPRGEAKADAHPRPVLELC